MMATYMWQKYPGKIILLSNFPIKPILSLCNQLYKIATVLKEVCDGKLRSGKSKPLLIPLKGMNTTSESMSYSLFRPMHIRI